MANKRAVSQHRLRIALPRSQQAKLTGNQCPVQKKKLARTQSSFYDTREKIFRSTSQQMSF